eukprot:10267949-Heterocapsa_arctica.AAC.1
MVACCAYQNSKKPLQCLPAPRAKIAGNLRTLTALKDGVAHGHPIGHRQALHDGGHALTDVDVEHVFVHVVGVQGQAAVPMPAA